MNDKEEEKDNVNGFPKLIWSTKQMVALLGMTPRNLQILVDKGIAVRESRGKYEVLPTVQNYVKYIRDGDTDSQDAKSELEKERVRLTKGQADQVQIKNAMLKGEIVLIEDACELLRSEAGSVRAAIEGSEPVLIDLLSDKINTHAEVAEAVRSAHNQALQKLTLDTDNPTKPKSNSIPEEFLVDENTKS